LYSINASFRFFTFYIYVLHYMKFYYNYKLIKFYYNYKFIKLYNYNKLYRATKLQ